MEAVSKKDEEEKRRHEYLVMEMQLGEQRVIDEISAKIDARVAPLEARATKLETFQKHVEWTVAGAPAVGGVAWFCFKLGQTLKGLKLWTL